MNGPSQEKLTLFSFRMPRRRYLMALGFVMAMSVGVLYDRWLLIAELPRGSAREFQLMAQAWNIIHRNYVDRGAIKSSALTHGAIEGMTDALGDGGHTVYLNPEMRRHAGTALRAKYTGIGVEIGVRNHQVVIAATYDDSPALRAGVKPGDIIMEVDDVPVAGLPSVEISDRITGPAGQAVKLGLLNPHTGRHQDITIVRGSIKVKNVSWQALPETDVAHLRIAMFSEGVGSDLRDALREIEKAGLKRIILDLRNDPGGVVDEAVSVASEFLTGGNVLLEKNAEGKLTPHEVKPGGLATKMPVVILINGGSASASEIVAGALRDAHRAKLVGEKTFGTGTVLQEFQLMDGSAILLAVGEWLTPSGKSFWHKGIQPDTEVKLGESAPLTPPAERGMSRAEMEEHGDKQLFAALTQLDEQEKEAKK